jgi:hypothetical protein
MSDKKTLFQEHVERVAQEAEDHLRTRKTGVACEFVRHPEGADWHAVMIVGVDTSGCCMYPEENKQVRMCWTCITGYAYVDEFVCRCEGEGSTHESSELTFVGEIQPSEAAEREAQNA